MAITQDPVVDTGAHRRRWTREEYCRMAEVGILGEDDRVELIEGEIVELAAEYAPHSTGIGLLQDALALVFARGYSVRVQHPLWLPGSDPEPDLAIVLGTRREYKREHPTTALLVVEVSYSTLVYDRTDKVSIYARANIPEYWILNLVDEQLEVHREPGELPGGGFGYRSRQVLRRGQVVRPVARPEAEIAVGELLP